MEVVAVLVTLSNQLLPFRKELLLMSFAEPAEHHPAVRLRMENEEGQLRLEIM